MDRVSCRAYNILLLTLMFADLSYASPRFLLKPFFTTVKNSSNHVNIWSNRSNDIQMIESSFSLKGRHSGDSEISAEPCTGDNSFCDDETDFPLDIVNNITEKYGSILTAMMKTENDYIIDDRMGDPTSEFGLCGAQKGDFFPTKVYTEKGWRFVINTKSFSQSFKIEVCKEEGESCLQGVSVNFKCQQKYAPLRVLVLTNEDELPKFRRVKIPFHCACELKNIFLQKK